MIGLLRLLLGKVKAEGAFIVLLAVAGAGAWLYVQWRTAEARATDLRHRVDVICARAGVEFAPKVGKPGEECAATVGGLAAFRTKTGEESARALAEALADHDAKQLKDNQAARATAEAMRDAALKMEAADAEAERRNLVDREWTAAVNRVAGLRGANAAR